MEEQLLMMDHLHIPHKDLVVKDYIGGGGFGAVFNGVWKGRGGSCKVAIKKIKTQGEQEVKDIWKEVQTMALLRFENICQVYGGCIIDDKEVWLVLQLVEGGNLRSFLSTYSPLSTPSYSSNPLAISTSSSFSSSSSSSSSQSSSRSSPSMLPWELQLSFSIQATRAVNYLHSSPFPILHRDLKSLNFMVQSGNKLLMIDFGMSKVKEMVTTQTNPGTLAWAAPEILKDPPEWSEKADIYSLGMTFYEIASGKTPFQGERVFSIHQKIIQGSRPEIPPECPKKFADIIEQCWSQNPVIRPNSQELLDRLLFLEEFGLEKTIPEVPKLMIPSPILSQINAAPRSPRPRSPSHPLALITPPVREEPPSLPSFSPTLSARAQSPPTVVRPRSNSFSPPSALSITKPSPYGAVAPSPPLNAIQLSPHSSNSSMSSTSSSSTSAIVSQIKALFSLDPSPRNSEHSSSHKVKLESPDKDGNTLLHFAAKKATSAEVRGLIERGYKVTEANHAGETPLHFAAMRDKEEIEIVMELIKSGADTNAKTHKDKSSPLHLAVEHNHIGMAKELLNNGARIEIHDAILRTPLHIAAFYGRSELVKILIERGADVHARNKNEQTPLHWVAQDNEAGVVKILLDHGAEVDAVDNNGETPLHYTTNPWFGRKEVAKVLVERGANINATNHKGQTPYQLALERNEIHFAAWMLKELKRNSQ